jgi:hypothetical protein
MTAGVTTTGNRSGARLSHISSAKVKHCRHNANKWLIKISELPVVLTSIGEMLARYEIVQRNKLMGRVEK